VLGANFCRTEFLLPVPLVESLSVELDFLLVVEGCPLAAVCADETASFAVTEPAASEAVT